MTEGNSALEELGRLITERRESIGMTLETVFDRTKIRPEYLRGIEEGNYTNFPELVYTKGFVRTYLKLINAEDLQDDFMKQLDRAFIPNSRKQELQRQRGINNMLGNGSSVPKGFKAASHFWIFLVLVLALVGTGAYVWYAVNYSGLDLRNLKLFNFSGSSNNGLFDVPDNSSNDVITNLSRDVAANPVSVDKRVVSSEPVKKPEPVKPSLEIRAINDVWLSVAFGNAQPVFRRTLRRGDSMKWDLNAPARVVFGRPTSAQVILNGKDLGIVNRAAKKSETHIYNPDGTTQKIK
ncbi:MAG: DUF4115 domain-containing protein [Synergistaceae bacterium]|nr:DUF4115 domain-containing protein [Synergistaceae bacterium]